MSNSHLVSVDPQRSEQEHQSQQKSNQFVYDMVTKAAQEEKPIQTVLDVTVQSLGVKQNSEHNHINEKEIVSGEVTIKYTDLRGEEFVDNMSYHISAGKQYDEFVYDTVEVTLSA